MPQPYSSKRIKPEFAFGPPALKERPELSLQVMDVIHTWSNVDNMLFGIIAHLLHADHAVVASMLQSVTQEAQRAALLAGVKSRLNTDDSRLFDAAYFSTGASRKQRNNFAHHIWGVSVLLPDDLLLVDPKDYNAGLSRLNDKLTSGKATADDFSFVKQEDIQIWTPADIAEARDASKLSLKIIFTLCAIMGNLSSRLSIEPMRRCLVDFDPDIAVPDRDRKLDLAHGEILSGYCLDYKTNREKP